MRLIKIHKQIDKMYDELIDEITKRKSPLIKKLYQNANSYKQDLKDENQRLQKQLQSLHIV